MHKFAENIKTSYGVFSSALGGETSDKVESATFVYMKDYDLAVVHGFASNVVSGQVITLAVLQATAANGGGSTTVSGASTTVTSGATATKYVLTSQVRGAQLTDGYKYVGLRISTDDTDGTEAVFGCIQRANARFAGASMPA